MGLIRNTMLIPRGVTGPTRPSQETSIKGSDITRGLVFAIVPQVGGAQVGNLIDGSLGAFAGSTKPSWAPGGYLSFPSGAASVASLDYGTSKLALTRDLAQGAFSVVAKVKRGTSTGGGIAERNDGNTINAGWLLYCNANCTQLTMERASVNFAFGTSTAIPVGKWTTVGVTYDGSLNSATGGFISYDGVGQTITTTANGSGIQGSDFANSMFVGRCGFNNNAGIAGCFDGQIEFLYIWRRKLSKEEILSIHNQPYAMFRNPRIQRHLVIPVAAAGGFAYTFFDL